jgi:hypothetical protein
MGRQLVITGMHRSGTSLAASAMQQAGVDIGHDLIGVGHGNRRGHFEDWDFHRLHEAMLAAAGQSCFTAAGDLSPPPDSPFEERARSLVAVRSGLELWGWKDPRSCLFLELWDALLPAASYLMVYRHPVDVALSLLRRDLDRVPRDDPWAAFRSWEAHNRCLLALWERHPERVFLAHVPTAMVDLEAFVDRVAAKLALPLQAQAVSSLLVPGELSPSPRGEGIDWERLIPESLSLYRQLEARADLPSCAADREGTKGAAAAGDEELRPAEREHLRVSERLLHALLESRLALAAQHERERALAEARAAQTDRLAEVSIELEMTRDRRGELAETLTEIESSRSFVVVSSWWRLRRYIRRRLNGGGDPG